MLEGRRYSPSDIPHLSCISNPIVSHLDLLKLLLYSFICLLMPARGECLIKAPSRECFFVGKRADSGQRSMYLSAGVIMTISSELIHKVNYNICI